MQNLLFEKHAKTESSPEQLEQPHGYGSWAGQIVTAVPAV